VSGPGPELRADCARCAGLCCVAPAFTASADFAIDKKGGEACPHLGRDFRCDIHDRLRPSGFGGCATFDCFGAGQQVTQVTHPGRNWRTDPEAAPAMFASFAVMRPLHELRWHVREALTLVPQKTPLARELAEADRALRQHASASPGELAALDLDAVRRPVTAALRRELSPRHVPDRVVAVSGIPRTLTGKKLEAPVKRILRGEPPDKVASRDSLADPAALDAFVALAAERSAQEAPLRLG